MKKIFLAIAFAAILMIPFTSFAMTQVADSDLSSVTGQSGVSINLDVNMDISATTIAWGDSDGFTFATTSANYTTNTQNEGWVGLSNLQITGLRIQARQDLLNTAYTNLPAALTVAGMGGAPVIQAKIATALGTYLATDYEAQFLGSPNAYEIAHAAAIEAALAGLPGTANALIALLSQDPYVQTDPNSVTLFTDVTLGQGAAAYLAASNAFLPLTIDVATGSPHGTQTYVRIGLGSIQITMASMTADVKVGNSSALTSTGGSITGNTMGSLYLGNLTVLVNGNDSYVDIYAEHNTSSQGVTINPNITLDTITIDELAWGDKDGLGADASIAGGVTPAGWVTGTTAGWVGLKNLAIGGLVIAGYVNIDVATATSNSQPYVNIGFGGSGLAITIGSMNATVALGSVPTNLNQELGSIYISGMTVTLTGGVEIMAHQATEGVVINLNNLNVAISSGNTISWGDNTTGGGFTAGYVGLTNLTISGLTLGGLVSIDVATITADPLGSIALLGKDYLMYSSYDSHNISNSVVHIGLGTGDANDSTTNANTLAIGITSLTANVVLGSNAALSLNPGTLGIIAVNGLSAKMNGWVDIGAH